MNNPVALPAEGHHSMAGADTIDATALIAEFLRGRSAATVRAYAGDLAHFARWLNADDAEAAARALLACGQGKANMVALKYRSTMTESGLAAATVNRRLAAVRSLVSLARMVGMVSWALDVRGVEQQRYRDTRGPGVDAVGAMLQAAAAARDPRKAARDVAMLRLMADCGLRRGEVLSIDLEHIDAKGCRVAVLGKGRSGREWITLPAPTMAAVAAWIEHRGDAGGALFCGMNGGGGAVKRLSGSALHEIVRRYGAAVGARTRPHGLRHCAITSALDATGGDVRTVCRFSRHASINTVMLYDDARRDDAGAVAALVAGRYAA